LIGNLTRDIELRSIAGNTSVGKGGLAINRKFKDASGATKEEVTFVDFEVWGNTAENLTRFTAKGDPVMLIGSLKLDQWEDKDGGKRSKLLVRVNGFELLARKDAAEQGRSGGGTSVSKGRHEAPSVTEDDIPF
jgi:single-strand DNA-binding protein